MSSIDPWSPGLNFPRQNSSPILIPFSQEQRHRRTSTASPLSLDDSDGRSDASFPSTTPSSTASNPLPAAMNPINYGYEFHCPFGFVGCELSFHPTQIDAYISHTRTHFFDYGPPPKTACIFCTQTFENPNDRVANWRERMRHIADHYRRFERFEDTRPDFFLIEYMRKKGIISSGDYKWATRYPERRDCDGLVDFRYKISDMKRNEARALEERPSGDGVVDFGYKPPEMLWEDNRMDGQMEELVSLEREDRLRRRARSQRFPSHLISGAKTVRAKIIANGDSESPIETSRSIENEILSLSITDELNELRLKDPANVDHSHGNSGTSTIGKCKASQNPGDAESEDQNYPTRRSRRSKASGGQCSRCMLQGVVCHRGTLQGACIACGVCGVDCVPYQKNSSIDSQKLSEDFTSGRSGYAQSTKTLDSDPFRVDSQPLENLAIPIPMIENRRDVLRVLIKKKDCIACPDSGSEKNIMSEALAVDRKLYIQRRRSRDIKEFQLGNGKFIWSIGRVRVKVQIPGLPLRKSLNFYVFKDCPVDLVLGISFLAKAKIFTTNRHLLEECPSEMKNISPLLWIVFRKSKKPVPEHPPNRLNCWLDGRSLVAAADTGSDLNMMSLDCARREEFEIDTRPESRRYVRFGDGTQGETIGQVYVYSFTLDWRRADTKIRTETSPLKPGSEADALVAILEPKHPTPSEQVIERGCASNVIFHVLPGLPCDVVLGGDLLRKTDAFNFCPDLLFSKSRGRTKAFELNVLISLGPWSKKLPGFRNREQGNTSAPHGKVAHDDERHDEMFRRSETEAKIARLPPSQRAQEEAKEKRKIREWDAVHVNCTHCNPV